MGLNLPCFLPFGKAGGLQILCCQGFEVNDYNFTLDALALKPSGFCNKGYSDWIIRFVKFHSNRKHPKEMGKTEIEAFLSHLATNRKAAASTQRQALNALVFLYKNVFPAKKLSKDPRSDTFRRHHVLESGLQKAVKIAVDRAGITKRVGTHTLRHCFATHLLEDGVNIRVVQELMGHADVKTTEIYTHVMEKDIRAVISPLETL